MNLLALIFAAHIPVCTSIEPEVISRLVPSFRANTYVAIMRKEANYEETRAIVYDVSGRINKEIPIPPKAFAIGVDEDSHLLVEGKTGTFLSRVPEGQTKWWLPNSSVDSVYLDQHIPIVTLSNSTLICLRNKELLLPRSNFYGMLAVNPGGELIAHLKSSNRRAKLEIFDSAKLDQPIQSKTIDGWSIFNEQEDLILLENNKVATVLMEFEDNGGIIGDEKYGSICLVLIDVKTGKVTRLMKLLQQYIQHLATWKRGQLIKLEDSSDIMYHFHNKIYRFKI